MYAVDPETGIFETRGDTVWNTSHVITATPTAIYMYKNSFLHSVDPFTGAIENSRRDYQDPKAMTYAYVGCQDRLFILDSSVIFSVDASNGEGISITGNIWTVGPFYMTYLERPSTSSCREGSLYVIENYRLSKVNPTTGDRTYLTGQRWTYSNIAIAGGYGDHVYIIESGTIFKVDADTGSVSELTTVVFTSSPIAMARFGGDEFLYVFVYYRMWKVSTVNGSFVQVGANWDGTSIMVAPGQGIMTGTSSTTSVATTGTTGSSTTSTSSTSSSVSSSVSTSTTASESSSAAAIIQSPFGKIITFTLGYLCILFYLL